MNLWHKVFDVFLITLELLNFLTTGRVTAELAFTPYGLQVGSLCYLPVIFYTVCQSFGSLGQTILLGLIREQNCLSFGVTCFIQIGAFGDFGFIPGLCVAVFLPYLGFSRSLALRRLNSFDCIVSFFWSVFAVFVIWALYFYVLTHYGGIKQHYHYCFSNVQVPLIIISIQSIAFLVFIFYLWIRGLQIYFQTMYNVDRISIPNVVARASMFQLSQDILDCVESPNDIDSEIEGGIQEVVDHYGDQFQWCMYLVLIAQFWFLGGLGFELIGYATYGHFMIRSGLFFRMCNLMFCWMFFQRKELRQNGRRLIPNCCFDYIKRLEDPWVNYDGDEESESSNGSDDEVDRFEFEDLESSSELSMLASMSNSVGII